MSICAATIDAILKAPTALVETPRRSTALVRVLHVINGEHYSGAERVQDLLALNLGRFGFDVGFACLKPGRFCAMRQSQSSRLIDMAMRSRFDLRPARALARVIQDENYALVHTHTPRAALVGRLASAMASVPLVHHLHSPTASDSTRSLQDRLNAWIERNSLIGVSAVVAVSASLARYAVEQGIDPERIAVVPNGVPARGRLAERPAPEGTWTLGTVALFRPRKGLEVLLDAIARLRRQGLDVKLRAIGEFETKEYRRKIMCRVTELGLADSVFWTGFTSHVSAELAKLDLFVLPSLFGEGLPMVVLEAMAAGVPIVGTRVEGVPEAVRDGIEGLLAPPADPIGLARAISRFIRGDVNWSELRVAAHRRHAESFSDRSMAQGVAQVYLQVLGC
jgi:phosphatidyl-myo-inositol alpha-mannosyltransferase